MTLKWCRISHEDASCQNTTAWIYIRFASNSLVQQWGQPLKVWKNASKISIFLSCFYDKPPLLKIQFIRFPRDIFLIFEVIHKNKASLVSVEQQWTLVIHSGCSTVANSLVVDLTHMKSESRRVRIPAFFLRHICHLYCLYDDPGHLLYYSAASKSNLFDIYHNTVE